MTHCYRFKSLLCLCCCSCKISEGCFHTEYLLIKPEPRCDLPSQFLLLLRCRCKNCDGLWAAQGIDDLVTATSNWLPAVLCSCNRFVMRRHSVAGADEFTSLAGIHWSFAYQHKQNVVIQLLLKMFTCSLNSVNDYSTWFLSALLT